MHPVTIRSLTRTLALWSGNDVYGSKAETCPLKKLKNIHKYLKIFSIKIYYYNYAKFIYKLMKLSTFGFPFNRRLLRSEAPRSPTGRDLEHDSVDKPTSHSDKIWEGHQVVSAVTGGRPLSFSRRINGGTHSSPAPKERGRMRRGQGSPVDML